MSYQLPTMLNCYQGNQITDVTGIICLKKKMTFVTMTFIRRGSQPIKAASAVRVSAKSHTHLIHFLASRGSIKTPDSFQSVFYL